MKIDYGVKLQYAINFGSYIAAATTTDVFQKDVVGLESSALFGEIDEEAFTSAQMVERLILSSDEHWRGSGIVESNRIVLYVNNRHMD